MRVGLVPAEYFEVLGLKPLIGRLFRDEENRWGISMKQFWATTSGRRGSMAILRSLAKPFGSTTNPTRLSE